MENMPYRIEAKKASPQRADIYITGTIGGEVVAENFRREVDELTAQGVTDAHVYLFGPGGSCFEADEMVNILLKFSGRLTGEGGALVASAYTYIATFFDEFILPANGLFMIHKPKGGVCGTAAEVQAYHKLLADMETKYYDRYKAKAKDAGQLAAKWSAGDWWMTAAEAVAAGFATGVKAAPARIDTTTAQMIAACGYPQDTNLLITKIDENMDLNAMAASLGLPEGATEGEIQARIEARNKEVADLQQYKREREAREKQEQADRIEAELNAAVADHRITAETVADWRQTLTENYDRGSKLLKALVPVDALSKTLKAPQGKSPIAAGKTFEQLQDDDPETLKALFDNDPETYNALFDDWKRRNRLK